MNRRWVTHAEAVGQSPYDLARYWGDPLRWPLSAERDAVAALHRLATMAALVDWLTRWMPIDVHAALLGGASVAEVAAALGVPPGEVRPVWVRWVDGQVHLWQTTAPNRLGVSPEQADQVRAVLDAFDAAQGGERS